MDFFGIGPLELLLILIVALIVVGPGKLPGIARTIGKTVRAVRKASAELTTAVTREMEAVEKAEKSEKSAAALPKAPAVDDRPTNPEGSPPTP
jgi:sec-independent protein translocase protein TatA